MLLFSWLAASAGVVLFHVALAMTVRANSTTRIPLFRESAMIPVGSLILRAGGAGLMVLGAVLLGTHAWYLPFAVVLAGPIVAVTIIAFHNTRVAARTPG